MSAGLLAANPEQGEALPDRVEPAKKAKRISSAGDVAALAVLVLGGLVGVICLPVLAVAHGVQRYRKKRRRRQAQAEEESDPDLAQDDDARWPFAPGGEPRGKASELPAGTTRHTGYVTMSDGVRIAVDVLLPACAQGADGSLRPVPTVLHTARYWRAFELRWPLRELLNRGEPWDFLLGPWKAELVRSGFAVMSADVRGAGASGGVQSVVWSERETQDSLELIDFIVGSGTARPRQAWSDGQVALFGVSYDAGAAVRAAAQKHPAVKALVASFLFGDIWRELFPGGVMNRWFLQHWCDVNARLDNARVSKIHPMAPLMIRGAAPVACRKQHTRFVAEHRDNWDLMAAAGSIEAIDDPVKLSSGETMSCENLEIFSDPLPSLQGQAVLPSVAKSELPVLMISGWMCVTSASACAAFSALAGKSWRLLIGPWNHGGVQQVRYCRETKFLQFPKAQAVNEFLLHHMARRKTATPAWLASDTPEAHFYVCGARPAWQHSTSWPPQNVAKKPLWLSKSSKLSWTQPDNDEGDGSASQLPVATGQAHLVWGGISRYNAMIKMMELVKYQWKQSAVDSGKALLFETPALASPVAMLGSPVLSLRLRAAGDEDADVFAYLCERPPDGGDLVYVTEGILRLSKRKEEDAPEHEKAADPDRSKCGNSTKAAEIDAGFVPHHSYKRGDIEMLPSEGGMTTARLKMFAAAYRFRAGSKMVLVIAPDDTAHYASNPKAGSKPPFICHSATESSLLWLPLEGDTTAVL